MTTVAKHTILYADDDLDDLFIVSQAFKAQESDVTIIHAKNGLEALTYLDELHARNTRPCLVILDINMPGMNGREALVKIRQSNIFKKLPVVLFTTSSSLLDREFARKWNADFITKPLIYSELEGLARIFISLCGSEISKRA